MSTELRSVHPQGQLERTVNVARGVVRKARLSSVARPLVLRLARLTYRYTLRCVPSRDELPQVLNARGLTGDGVEIGVERAEYSAHLLTAWRGDRLISVDPWLEVDPEQYVDTSNVRQATQDQNYVLSRQRLAPFGTRSSIWRMTSEEAAAAIEPGSLDFVYIDARHDFDSVSEDLAAWWPLLRRGGMLAGHDYNDGHFAQGVHGVRSAVDGFFATLGIPVRHTWIDVPCRSWMVVNPGGGGPRTATLNGR